MPVESRADRVRTYHARRGRLSALTRTRLAELLPRYAAPAALLRRPRDPGGPGRIALEIGCGHGAAALGYAAAHPRDALIALDVHPPGVARLLAATAAAGLGNLYAEIGDAVGYLDEQVGPGALDAVHLFFPDPWPKARHRRRRFVSADTLDLLADRLTPDGQLLLATDSPAYVDTVRREVAAHGAFVVLAAQRPGWRPVAGFEAKAIDAGRPVTELRLTRPCRPDASP